MSYVFTAASNTKIDYGHVSAFDGAAKVSVSYWIKPTGGDTYGGIMSQMGANTSGNGEQAGFEISILAADPKDLIAAWRNEAGATTPYMNTNSDHFSTTAWNHVLMVYDGTQATNSNKVKVYVNGTLVVSNLNYSGTLPATLGTNNKPLKFGENRDGSTLNFTGKLAEVGFWIGTALGSGDATTLAGGALCSSVTGCTHQMRLLADANDSVGSLTGTVTSATLDAGDHPTMTGGGGAVASPAQMFWFT